MTKRDTNATQRVANATNKKTHYIDRSVEARIQELALKGWKPPQILDHLAKSEKYADRVPNLRTIQRKVKELEPSDPSGPWSLTNAEREDAPVVMDTINAILRKSEGSHLWPSVAVARWVGRVKRVAPDLDPWGLYLVARTYLLREEGHEPTTDLDAFLALAPWRSPEGLSWYTTLIRAGQVPTPPAFVWWDGHLGASMVKMQDAVEDIDDGET